MILQRTTWSPILYLFVIILFCFSVAHAEDPCANAKRRALVLSGGGSKGAFETGAVYHLVVHRRCDFHEFSGASVGALNGAFLAQAAEATDRTESLANLITETEGLVSLWQSVKGSRDIRKGRPLATLRFGLFGLENLSDFAPLRRLLDANISTEKLAKGRPVRTSVVSFWDGEYREVLARPLLSKRGGTTFLDYLYASSVPPVYGKLPTIVDGSQADNPKLWPQMADGGLRHITPVASYFKAGKTLAQATNGVEPTDAERERGSRWILSAPEHEPLQQLFVIVTSPYARDSELLPVTDSKCCRPGTRQITDGRKILGRTLALMDDTGYRADLDFMFFANDMLRWRWQAYRHLSLNTPAAQLAEAKRQLLGEKAFAVESYNRDPQDPDAPSLPYDIGLITPDKEFANPEHLLDLSPQIIHEQLYCGCIAADQMMQRDFNLPSLSDQCAQRFPPLAKARKGKAHALPTQWKTTVCENVTRPGPDTRDLAAN
jgi:predicted acylesterase/phospholipase RssA